MENVIDVLLLFATTLPFASSSVPVTVAELFPPSAGMLDGLTEQAIFVALPKTVIAAEAVDPPALAVTLHG